MITKKPALFFLLALASLAGQWGTGNAFAQAGRAASRVAPDPLGHFVRASGIVDTGTGRFHVELLHDDAAAAALRVREEGATDYTAWALADYSSLLALLADRRLSFLWEPLLEWAGPSLEQFRSRAIADAREAFERRELPRTPLNNSEWAMRADVRRVLRLSTTLEMNGHTVEALNLLRAQLARTSVSSRRGRLEYSSLATTIAGVHRSQGDLSAALATLSAAEEVLRGAPFEVNLVVNRAAFLAEAGRYEEALTSITHAERLAAEARERDRIPGSGRELAWIRACALHGLGRTAEARAALVPALDETEFRDPQFVAKSGRSIRLRAYACMKDVEGVVRELLGEAEERPFLPTTFLMLQPALRRPAIDPEFMAQVRAHPRIATAIGEHMRALPEALEPALNAWRDDADGSQQRPR